VWHFLSILGIHDFGACILHPLVQVCNLVGRNLSASCILREEGQDCGTGVAANNWNVDAIDVVTCDFVNELVGTDNVESGHTDNLLWVEALLPVQLAHGGHDGVHWVHDQGEDRIGAVFAAGLHNTLGDACVDTQEIGTCHAWLTGQSCWNQDEIAAGQALRKFLDGLVVLAEGVGADLDPFLKVAQIGRNTSCWHHGDVEIVDAELFDILVHCHEHAKWLPDTTGATSDADLEVAGHLREEMKITSAKR